MQRCQDQLDFPIETPSDAEVARRFANHQRRVDQIRDQLLNGPQHHQAARSKSGFKPRNRKSKQQKKQERRDRAKPSYRKAPIPYTEREGQVEAGPIL